MHTRLTRIAGNFNNCCDGDILPLISSKVLLFCCILVGADLIRLLYMRRWRWNKIINTYKQYYRYGFRTRS